MASTSTNPDCLVSSIVGLLNVTHTDPPAAESSTVPDKPAKTRKRDENDTGTQPKKSVRFNSEQLDERALYTDTELLRTPEREKLLERFKPSPDRSMYERHSKRHLLIKNRKCTPLKMKTPTHQETQVKLGNINQRGSAWINIDDRKILP